MTLRLAGYEKHDMKCLPNTDTIRSALLIIILGASKTENRGRTNQKAKRSHNSRCSTNSGAELRESLLY